MEPRRGFKSRFFEYFVAVSVIVILTAVSFIFLSDALASARDAERIADMVALRTALELYRSDHGRYPSGVANSGSADWEDFGLLMEPYLSSVPRDPINDTTGRVEETSAYNYTYRATRREDTGAPSYALTFRLERQKGAPLAAQVNIALAADTGAPIPGVYTLSAP